MIFIITVQEKSVCRKIAGVFKYANRYGFHPIEFTKFWLESETFDRLYKYDLTAICQFDNYHFDEFLKEAEKNGWKISHTHHNYEDLMYWTGYFLSYFAFNERVSGKDIVVSYDIDKIMRGYETLHTVSCEVAIELMKEDFSLPKVTMV